MNNSKNIHRVWWYDQATSEKSLAGIAQYHEETGHYSLRLNFFPNNKYLVEAVGAESNISHYRVLSVKKSKSGKTQHKFNQGSGFLDQVSGDVILKTNPFTKLILISGKENYEKRSA